MTEAKPPVTIGLPIFNGEKYLEQALSSLLSQEYKDFQLIISDNASDDQTRSICKKFSDSDDRIKYYRNEKNEGATFNFNRVLQLAHSEFFMWAAYDDLWDQAFLSTLVSLLQNNSTAVVAFAQAAIIDDHNNQLSSHVHLADYPVMYKLSEKNLYKRMKLYIQAEDGKSNMVYGLMRTKCIKKTNGFFGGFRTPYGSDILLIFRLLQYGEAIGSPNILYYKRATGKQEDPSIKSRILRFLSFRIGKFSCFLAYIPIIKKANLTITEKVTLSLCVIRRILQWIGNGIITALK